ncbi:MAG TPA: hypothetical protein GXX29_01830 [Firmicutes bacterium]|nr:hypothetical protein [Bacillota bacterium]
MEKQPAVNGYPSLFVVCKYHAKIRRITGNPYGTAFIRLGCQIHTCLISKTADMLIKKMNSARLSPFFCGRRSQTFLFAGRSISNI